MNRTQAIVLTLIAALYLTPVVWGALSPELPPGTDVRLSWFKPTMCPGGRLYDPEVWEVRQYSPGVTPVVVAELEDSHIVNPQVVMLRGALTDERPTACWEVRTAGLCGRMPGTPYTEGVTFYQSPWFEIGCASLPGVPEAPAGLTVAGGEPVPSKDPIGVVEIL